MKGKSILVRVIAAIVMLAMVGACSTEPEPQGVTLLADRSDFSAGVNGWIAGFSGYPVDDSLRYDLQTAYNVLPTNIGIQNGIMLSGTNYGDNLFMYMKKKIAGLQPNTVYTVIFDVEFASNVMPGISASTNVIVKAGALSFEPKNYIEKNYYVLNVDRNAVSEAGGSDMIVLGDIAKTDKVGNSQFTLVTRSNADANAPLIASTNEDGEFWLIVGTDSSYKGNTTIYYTQVNVVFSRTY